MAFHRKTIAAARMEVVLETLQESFLSRRPITVCPDVTVTAEAKAIKQWRPSQWTKIDLFLSFKRPVSMPINFIDPSIAVRCMKLQPPLSVR